MSHSGSHRSSHTSSSHESAAKPAHVSKSVSRSVSSSSHVEAAHAVSVATYPKWHKFAIGSKFALTACIAGTMGSFLFGFNMGLLNSSINYVAAELWPCDVPGDGIDGDAWTTLQISDECMTLMGENIGQDISQLCNAGLSADELESNKCGDCVAPNAVTCDYASWMNTIVTTMVLIGAFLACMLAPKLLGMGLRTMNMICMIVYIVGDACSVCAGSVASMACARLIVGIGVGMSSILSPMYISQMSPVTKKGTYGTAHQLILTVGILLAVLIGLAFGSGPFLNGMSMDSSGVISVDNEVDQFDRVWWRVMMALGFIPVFVNLGVFAKVSMDTPQEYIEKGLYEDARQGLYRIYKTDKFEDVKQFYDDIFKSLEDARKARESGMTLGIAMKNPAYRKMVLIGCAGSAIQQLSGINVFVTASNQLFAQAGVEPSMVTVLSVIMTALNTIMTFPTLILIEKMGRKSLMVMGIAGQCVGAILPTIGAWVDPDAQWSQILSIVGIMLLVCSFSVAMGPVLWVWFTEIFPADVNNAASAALVATNWMTGILMVFVGTSITDNKVLFTLFTILNVGSLIFMQMFCKETKGLPTGQSPYLMNN